MVLRLKWLIVFNFLLSIHLFASENSKKNADIHFDKQQIRISHKTIDVETAKTTEQHQHGLMFRTALPKNNGMLFIFESEQPLNFWMKNTFIDLSIAYIDKNKKIVDIQEMKATSQMMVDVPPSYPSAKPAMYALEMNKGWFKKNNIKVGQNFDFLNK